MRRSPTYKLAVALVLQVVVISCRRLPIEQSLTSPPAPTQASIVAPSPIATPLPTSTADTEDQPSRRVDTLLSEMTLEEKEEKVGQLFMVSFKGTAFSPWVERMIQDFHIGGLLIFSANVSTLDHLQVSIAQAQEASKAYGAHIPLFIAIDHEGGIITRLGVKATEFPSNMAVGATRSVSYACLMADAMASELQAIGINMTLGPVLDVNTDPANPVIGTRSFGSDPGLVTKIGLAMIESYQQHNIIAVAKHFPGHGSTKIDSHKQLPTLTADRHHLEVVELQPFHAATAAGVDAIMTAHIAVPALDDDPTRPATLSAPILTGLLRRQWRFNGLIATDSLGMGAILHTVGMTKATTLAFQAGADLMMFGWDTVDNLSEIQAAYDALLGLVQEDPKSMERLDTSVRRILWVKAKRGILDWSPPLSFIEETVRSTEHLILAQRLAQDSVTLVRDESGILPLSAPRHKYW